jgi:hypothetical protein
MQSIKGGGYTCEDCKKTVSVIYYDPQIKRELCEKCRDKAKNSNDEEN